MVGKINPTRKAANARERARMKVLSKAFSRLKSSLPWVPMDTKLSKLDTLKLALSYINHLAKLLEKSPQNLSSIDCSFIFPSSLSWPIPHETDKKSLEDETIIQSTYQQVNQWTSSSASSSSSSSSTAVSLSSSPLPIIQQSTSPIICELDWPLVDFMDNQSILMNSEQFYYQNTFTFDSNQPHSWQYNSVPCSSLSTSTYA